MPRPERNGELRAILTATSLPTLSSALPQTLPEGACFPTVFLISSLVWNGLRWRCSLAQCGIVFLLDLGIQIKRLQRMANLRLRKPGFRRLQQQQIAALENRCEVLVATYVKPTMLITITVREMPIQRKRLQEIVFFIRDPRDVHEGHL